MGDNECTAMQGDHERRLLTLEADSAKTKSDVLTLQINDSATQVKLDRIINDIRTLMDRPQKRFDSLVAVLISSPVSALIGIVMSKLFAGK